MQPVRAALPELDRVRAQQVAAPVGRARHLAGCSAAASPRARSSASRTAIDACSGATPRRRSGCRRARLAKYASDSSSGSGSTGPSSRIWRWSGVPVDRDRAVRVRGQLAALAALAVGVERHAAVVDPAQQHHADRRAAVRRGRGERRRLRLGHALGAGERVPVEDLLERIGHAHIAIATYLVSRYSSMPSLPPSRPKPDALTPPNGAAGLETMPWLRPTMPVSSPSTTRNARLRSEV